MTDRDKVERRQPVAPLLPCPFCGGSVELEQATHGRNDRRDWWGVVCRNTMNLGGTCAIEQIPSASKEAAVERWNRRAACLNDAQPSTAPAHTDHPLRHYDRTCPSCTADVAVPRSDINDLLEYFEQREDASTDSGDWQGNEEMSFAQRLRALVGETRTAIPNPRSAGLDDMLPPPRDAASSVPEPNKYAASAVYATRRYPCGCGAQGFGDIPAYCAEHGTPPSMGVGPHEFAPDSRFDCAVCGQGPEDDAHKQHDRD